MNTFQIIAHRGMFNNPTIPENSLAAFRRALDFSYPIELDVQLTKDNVLVVFHDDNLKRITGVDKLVKDCTYSEIKKLFLFDTKEHIPTFQEVINLIGEKVFLDIEIKPTKRIVDTCSILMNTLSSYSNYSLKSFHPSIVRYLKKHYPNVIVGYLISSNYSKRYYNWILSKKFLIQYTKADFISISKKLLYKKRLHRLSLPQPMQVWTIKSSEELKNPKYVYICNNLPYFTKKQK